MGSHASLLAMDTGQVPTTVGWLAMGSVLPMYVWPAFVYTNNHRWARYFMKETAAIFNASRSLKM